MACATIENLRFRTQQMEQIVHISMVPGQELLVLAAYPKGPKMETIQDLEIFRRD